MKALRALWTGATAPPADVPAWDHRTTQGDGKARRERRTELAGSRLLGFGERAGRRAAAAPPAAAVRAADSVRTAAVRTAAVRAAGAIRAAALRAAAPAVAA